MPSRLLQLTTLLPGSITVAIKYQILSSRRLPKAHQGKGIHLSDYRCKAQDRRPERLEIRQVLHPWHRPSYRYLFDISYDGMNGTIANLIFTPMHVEIRGKNLQAVIDAIGDGQCQFIQDFDARAFLEPAPGEPIIESIKITKSSDERE